MRNKKLPSIELIRSLFTYDGQTGELRWCRRRANVQANTIAGYINVHGYRVLSINKGRYYAHRVIWRYAYGRDPADEIDHKNGKKDDNRLSNLREAISSQNKMNTSRKIGFGLKGVTLHHTGRWVATCGQKGTRRHLGIFDTPEQAHAAYREAAERLFGEFARVA